MDVDKGTNAKVFKAFCDERRLSILAFLQGGERCACVLNEALDIPQSTLSYHMKILCDSGIVKGRQEGKWTHYSIDESGVMGAMALLKGLISYTKSEEKAKCNF